MIININKKDFFFMWFVKNMLTLLRIVQHTQSAILAELHLHLQSYAHLQTT